MPRARPTAGPSGSSTQFELVVKYPGFWKTRFKDSYWSVPASEISKRAEQEKKLATTAMGLSELPGGEKDRLNDAIRNFNELTSDYQSAVRAKDKESAQKYVKGMEDSIRALNKAHTVSVFPCDWLRAKLRDVHVHLLEDQGRYHPNVAKEKSPQQQGGDSPRGSPAHYGLAQRGPPHKTNPLAARTKSLREIDHTSSHGDYDSDHGETNEFDPSLDRGHRI
ncbi:hypothetical protein NMY22_g18927 [Coprinellus aureogranulatus]|nr:hypothetical protein NMY22_g18927 [Coprinellus aureogranulatus]